MKQQMNQNWYTWTEKEKSTFLVRDFMSPLSVIEYTKISKDTEGLNDTINQFDPDNLTAEYTQFSRVQGRSIKIE